MTQIIMKEPLQAMNLKQFFKIYYTLHPKNISHCKLIFLQNLIK